jgi:hypothetical protein
VTLAVSQDRNFFFIIEPLALIGWASGFFVRYIG